ncbi:hypothetical protein GQR36_21175 [Enterococcus termitis]
MAKQEEIDKLSEEQIVIMANDAPTDSATFEELAEVRQELEETKRQLAKKTMEIDQQLSKEDIGEVLLEAKNKQKRLSIKLINVRKESMKTRNAKQMS